MAVHSGNVEIDLSKFDVDAEILPGGVTVDSRVRSLVNSLRYHCDDLPAWTPRNIGKHMAIAGNGPVLWALQPVADFLGHSTQATDFNVSHVVITGSFDDLADLVVPELRHRGVYAPRGEAGTI